jgi:NADH:ubiquinone oxidoreductase subunit E
MSQVKVIHICLGSSCFSRGNKDVVAYIKEYLKKNHLEDKVVFKGARCMGNCSRGPNMKIGEDIRIEGITLTGIEEILDKHLSRLK